MSLPLTRPSEFNAGVDLAREIEDEAKEAKALERLGRIEKSRGHYDNAIRRLQKADSLYTSVRDDIGRGRVAVELGRSHYTMGDAEKGHHLHRDAINRIENGPAGGLTPPMPELSTPHSVRFCVHWALVRRRWRRL